MLNLLERIKEQYKNKLFNPQKKNKSLKNINTRKTQDL